jgi:hypothetical protein
MGFVIGKTIIDTQENRILFFPSIKPLCSFTVAFGINIQDAKQLEFQTQMRPSGKINSHVTY